MTLFDQALADLIASCEAVTDAGRAVQLLGRTMECKTVLIHELAVLHHAAARLGAAAGGEAMTNQPTTDAGLIQAALPFAVGMTIFPHHDDGDDELEITITRRDMRRLCAALDAVEKHLVAPQKAEPTGENPFSTPTIMAAFRAHKEAEWGAKLADEQFKLGLGEHAHEPYYTSEAVEFRRFKAGAEWLEAFSKERGFAKLLLARLTEAEAEVADLEAQQEHYAQLMLVDPSAMPQVFWKDRALAGESHLSTLQAELEAARGNGRALADYVERFCGPAERWKDLSSEELASILYHHPARSALQETAQ